MGIGVSIQSSPVLPPLVLRGLVLCSPGLLGLVLPVVVGLSIVFPGLASAHHSRAEYTGEPIEFEGSLVDILWRNPHPAFTVEVNGNGQAQTWQVEGWSSL